MRLPFTALIAAIACSAAAQTPVVDFAKNPSPRRPNPVVDFAKNPTPGPPNPVVDFTKNPSLGRPNPVVDFAKNPSPRPTTLDVLHAPLLRRDLRIEGAPSCAAASCHGGPRPGVARPPARWANSYQLWVENDPHARSWRTFCSDESVAMMRRLKILDADGQVLDRAGYDNCLACHNSTDRFDTPDPLVVGHRVVQDFIPEGVGCSGCHGPSERWAGPHTRRGWDAVAAINDGFVPNGDLLVRARMCASCHVGDVDRDMNHDIIAAGHPALRYEFATYHHRQPKHWRDIEENDPGWYEAQLWLAGQIAATDASLALMVKRAAADRTGDAISHWPEFSAHDCASCHHTLGFANRRPPIGPRPAIAPASRWNDIAMRWILGDRADRGLVTAEDLRLLDSLDRVRDVLQSATRPSTDDALNAALEARQSLAAWVANAHQPLSPTFGAAAMAELVRSAAGRTDTYETWESTTQYYLAAVASREAWPALSDDLGQTESIARSLQLGLRYPGGLDVPRFSKTEPSPRLQRTEAARVAVDLASTLGPVASPDLQIYQSDDEKTQRLEQQRLELRDRIERELQRRQTERQAAIDAAPKVQPPRPDPDAPMPAAPADPAPPRNDRERLLEQLRRRQSENPFGDD